MTPPEVAKLLWYGAKPPTPTHIFEQTLHVLYTDACLKRPDAAGFLMLLWNTLFPPDFTEYFNIAPDLYSIHVIPLTTDILTQILSSVVLNEASGHHFESFIV